MQEEIKKLTDEELKARWETEAGKKFRQEIIRQLQSEKTKHSVDWDNLKIVLEVGREVLWRDFPGVSEVENKRDLREIVLQRETPGLSELEEANLEGVNLKGAKLVEINLRGANLEGVNLEEANLEGTNLKKTKLMGANLKGAYLEGVNLEEANLVRANLEGANLLLGNLDGVKLERANLQGADLTRAGLKGAILRGANLKRVDLFEANLERANLVGANLKEAKLFRTYLPKALLIKANLEGADLTFAYLEIADLTQANIEGADLTMALLKDTNLTNAIFRLKSFWWRIGITRAISWIWEKRGKDNSSWQPTQLEGAEIKNVKLDSDPLLYRDLQDEQWLDRFAAKHRAFYRIWLVTSDCGRTTWLVLLWSVIIALGFGLLYAPTPSWWHFHLLESWDPRFIYEGTKELGAWWPYYMSFVTMTTLGWSSANPANVAGVIWHTLQNVFGYIWLGYLISVLGSKLTRRSG